jgi:hypothetical protein
VFDLSFVLGGNTDTVQHPRDVSTSKYLCNLYSLLQVCYVPNDANQVSLSGLLWIAFDAAAPSNPSLRLILRNSVNELHVFVSSVIQLPTYGSCFVRFSEVHKTALLLRATQCGWILTLGHQRYQHGINAITIHCRALDRLCGLVVRVPGYRSRGPGSIPGATRFSEK